MTDYFLSLNVSSAKEVADKAREFFSRHGISTWMCTDIEGASTFRNDILTQVRDAKVFVIFLNEKWAMSNECLFEYNYAQRKYLTNGRPQIMPFVIEKFNFEKYPHVDAIMANVQGLFMGANLEDDLKALMEMLKGYVSYKPAETVAKATKPPKLSAGTAAKAFIPPKLPLSKSKVTAELVKVLKSLDIKEKNLPSGLWQGYFVESEPDAKENKAGSKWLLDVNLTFKNNNEFTGVGKDEIGNFTFQKGRIRDNKVQFLKSYFTHNVCYVGEVRGLQMVGRWWLETANDIKGAWALWPVSD